MYSQNHYKCVNHSESHNMKFTSLASSKKLVASFLLAMAALPAAHAQTYQTTVNGTAYNFTTVTGTANDNQNLLSAQPWFGSSSAAESFATALWNNLGGTVNIGELGPLFAYDGDDSSFSFAAYSFGGIVNFSMSSSETYTFAVATAVPVPEIDGALLPQALALMGASALFIRRRKS